MILTTILLSLCAAVAYGAGNFSGGFASRRVSVFAVAASSQLLGAVLLGAIVPVTSSHLSTVALLWGMTAGVGSGLGVTLLYRALAVGPMALVAPATAAVAAVGGVIAGLVLGDRPHVLVAVGMVMALLAIVLVSTPTSSTRLTPSHYLTPGLVLAAAAGISFAAFAVLLRKAPTDAGLWPVFASRSSIVVILVFALATRADLKPSAAAAVPIGLAGILDISANVLFFLAVHSGLLSLAVVITSLYPAVTVLLARIVLTELLSRTQTLGLAAAALGLALIALG